MVLDKYIEIKRKYFVDHRRPEEYIINKFFGYLFSPILTMFFKKLNVTPNSITILSGIVGIAASFNIVLNNYILASFFLIFHYLLDCTDGNLARLTNQSTDFGAKLDRFVDQIVRFTTFVAVAWVVDFPIWIKTLFVITIYIDVIIIHVFVLPFTKKHKLIRSKWKKWFLSKGIIPAFDIFLIYFLISFFLLINKLEILILIIIIGKNFDWIYRVWECIRTIYFYRTNSKV